MNKPKDFASRVLAGIAMAIALIAIGETFGHRTGRPQVINPTLARISASGNLRIAVVSSPPIASINPSTQHPEGYAVDAMNLFCRNAGLHPQYRPSDWSNFSAELASDQADIAIGPIFVTEGRLRDFAATDPLFAYAIVAVGPAAGSKLATPQDLAKPGLRIAVGRGGFDAEFVSRRMPQAVVNAFPTTDVNLPLLEVVAGRADLAIEDYAAAQAFCREHSELQILFGSEPLSVQYAAFFVRNDDPAFREFINGGLRNLELSGELKVLDAKYADRRTWFARVISGGQLQR